MTFKGDDDKPTSGAGAPPAAAPGHHRLPAHGGAALRRAREVHRSLEEAMSSGKESARRPAQNGQDQRADPDDIFAVGTIGTIIQLLRLPDGTVKVLIEGKRARASSASSRRAVFRVEVEELVEQVDRRVRDRALLRRCTRPSRPTSSSTSASRPRCRSRSAIDDPAGSPTPSSPTCNLKLADKQAILETHDPAARLERSSS
jgi:ATP-dependent Lon protease